MSPRTLFCISVCVVSFCFAWNSSQAGEKTEFPEEARKQYQQGQELRKKGQLNEAVSAFQEAIKLGMEAFPRVHLQQAGVNLDLKKYDTAIRQYTKIIEDFGVEESCRY